MGEDDRKKKECDRRGGGEGWAILPISPFSLTFHKIMFVLSTRTSLAARRTGVVAKASTGNWAPGTEKPKYLEGAPGYEELTGAFFFFFFFSLFRLTLSTVTPTRILSTLIIDPRTTADSLLACGVWALHGPAREVEGDGKVAPTR